MAPMTQVDVLEPRIGSLFSGYGGLDRGVQAVVGGSVSWHCDIDPGASKLLAHHWPETPNLGDVTAVDWAAVEPIDVLTGGFPCQDVSPAGRRAGMTPDSRSGLWTHMARAINVLRPRLVVIENVRGLLSADAHCDVEPCPWCLGDHEGRPLRALGAVLGDLAVLGYDASWHGIRASDAGAPHPRYRVFITATPGTTSDSDRVGQVRSGRARTGRRRSAHDDLTASYAPRTTGLGWAVNDSGPTGAVCRSPGEVLGGDLRAWGDFGPAIKRWELALGRVAPAPTLPGKRGGEQLSAQFVEWLMGLPLGHVTDVPGLSRNDQLKLLGNGVVPQQAELALRHLLDAPVADDRAGFEVAS